MKHWFDNVHTWTASRTQLLSVLCRGHHVAIFALDTFPFSRRSNNAPICGPVVKWNKPPRVFLMLCIISLITSFHRWFGCRGVFVVNKYSLKWHRGCKNPTWVISKQFRFVFDILKHNWLLHSTSIPIRRRRVNGDTICTDLQQLGVCSDC